MSEKNNLAEKRQFFSERVVFTPLAVCSIKLCMIVLL